MQKNFTLILGEDRGKKESLGRLLNSCAFYLEDTVLIQLPKNVIIKGQKYFVTQNLAMYLTLVSPSSYLLFQSGTACISFHGKKILIPVSSFIYPFTLFSSFGDSGGVGGQVGLGWLVGLVLVWGILKKGSYQKLSLMFRVCKSGCSVSFPHPSFFLHPNTLSFLSNF